MDPFVGEIKMFAFGFVPQGYAACDGTIMQVSQNQALNSLIYNQFGGDGRTTFALPDMRGRAPMNFSTMRPFPGQVTSIVKVADKGGAETVTLGLNQTPIHTHQAYGANAAATKSAVKGNLIAQPSGGINIYAPAASAVISLNPASITASPTPTGHNNMQPYSVVNFCIALVGLYPPRQ